MISGDNPVTVSKAAETAGIPGAGKYIDASLLNTKEKITKGIMEYNVFGRVTPDQKRLFIRALKKAGHTVAMTGDGVNDVLALKDADCSIARRREAMPRQMFPISFFLIPILPVCRQSSLRADA